MAAFFPRDRLYNNVAGCCFSERHTTCDKRRCSTRRWRSSPRHRLPPKRLDPLPAACAFSAGNLLCILLQVLLCCSPCCIPSCNSRSTRTPIGSTNFDAETCRYCTGTVSVLGSENTGAIDYMLATVLFVAGFVLVHTLVPAYSTNLYGPRRHRFID